MEVDQAYLELIEKVLTGKLKPNRTGINAISKFGLSTTIDARTISLITTKKVFTKTVIAELIWFLMGSTDVKKLNELGCKIWDANSTKEFLKLRGLDYEEKIIGPGYGHQWRNSGSEYGNPNSKGVDQLLNAIKLIKEDPNSRRIIVCSWVPSDINKMALPPCHCFYQFYVDEDKLNILVVQRSCDVFLGLPFNLASYSILLHIVSYLCDLKPNEMTFHFGDIHIYENHLDQINKVKNNLIYQDSNPIIKFSDKFRMYKDDPDRLFKEITTEDIKIVGYKSNAYIKAEMAV